MKAGVCKPKAYVRMNKAETESRGGGQAGKIGEASS